MIAEKYIVTEKHLIASIPVVEIVAIAVPLGIVRVPVHVDDTHNEHFCILYYLFHCQSKHISIRDCAVYYLKPKSFRI